MHINEYVLFRTPEYHALSFPNGTIGIPYASYLPFQTLLWYRSTDKAFGDDRAQALCQLVISNMINRIFHHIHLDQITGFGQQLGTLDTEMT